jgi:hypothetical protein
VISGAGLIDVELAGQVDTFGGASGEEKARQFGTTGYAIRARSRSAKALTRAYAGPTRIESG